MEVAAITVVRNEADIIAETVGWMLSQVDRVIVLDNLSTDNTGDIATSLGAEVVLDPNPAHDQGTKMTELALDSGASWVVPFDADEIWFAANGQTIREALTKDACAAAVAEAKILEHPAVPGDPAHPVRRMRWRRVAAQPLRKVACRVRQGMRILDGNHGVYYPGVPFPLTVTGLLEVRHFPYRTPEQTIRKIRQGAEALRLAGLDPTIGGHWLELDRLADDDIEDVFIDRHYSRSPDADPALVRDPAPHV